MRVLILSNTPWDNSNSFGSTFSNFFEGMENVEIANIYCQAGMPRNTMRDMRYFQMTEKTLIKNLLDRSVPSGHEVKPQEGGAEAVELTQKEKSGMSFFKKHRLRIFFWARELIWKVGRCKSGELKAFINEFEPDVIFQPIYDSFYLTRLALWLQDFTGKKAVGFVGDDLYSFKQFRLSPLFWTDRLLKRPRIGRLIKKCRKVMVMVETQKREYDKAFKIDCGLLAKSLDFEGEPELKEQRNEPVKFVYTGNIYAGRWQGLAALGRALDEVNAEGVKAQLDIYTLTPMTNAMKRALELKSVRMMGGVPSSEVAKIQSDADVLVYTEGMSLKEKLLVRLSFSTKLVDYMHTGRCMLAIGPKGISSMDHLIQNEAAVTVTDLAELNTTVKRMIEDKAYCDRYAKNAWECGKKHHNKKDVQQRLYNELLAAAEDNKA